MRHSFNEWFLKLHENSSSSLNAGTPWEKNGMEEILRRKRIHGRKIELRPGSLLPKRN